VIRIGNRNAEEGRFAAVAVVFWLTSFLSPLGWWTTLLCTLPVLYVLVGLVRRRAGIVVCALAAAVLAALFLSVEGLSARLGVDPRLLLVWRHFGLLALAAVVVALAGMARGAVRRGTAPA
jgi:hypothetical protein